MIDESYDLVVSKLTRKEKEELKLKKMLEKYLEKTMIIDFLNPDIVASFE